MSSVHTHVLPSVARKHPSAWQHGLFGCCNDIGTTCTALCCPFIIAGLNAEAVGESCILCGILGIAVPDSLAIYSNMVIRGMIRKKFGINGSTTRDCLAAALCPFCAYIQQRQEVLTRRAQADALAQYWRQRASPRRDRRNTDTRRTRLTIIYGIRRKFNAHRQWSCDLFNEISINCSLRSIWLFQTKEQFKLQ